jgi:type II secretory pathway predicted ATPase ExeA
VQPPDSLKSLSDPIYEAFYGLTEQPFAISTDPKFLFLSAPHRRAYDELMHGISRDESLMLLTGETGSGKTTLCRAVIGATGDRTFSSILHQPYMTGPEMLRLILRDFGMVSKEELRRGALAGADVPHLMEVLETFLASLAAVHARAIVVIDEAQSLSPTLLDEVRMLTAFERDGRRLVQIVLCGQPMLLNTLKTEPMYALNERITRRVVLTPLSESEVEAYIYHRLAIAGGADKISFEPDAMRLIAELSRGLPRRVNVLADRTLQEGRIEGAARMTGTIVKRAARALAGVQAAAAEAEQQAGVVSREAPQIDPADTIDLSSDALSSSIGGERRVGRAVRVLAGAAVLTLVVGGAGYWYYANGLVANGFDYNLPARSDVARPNPPAKMVPPSDEELEAYFRQMLRILMPVSPEIPRDRDNLD